MLLAIDFVDFDSFVGGAGREAAAVVVEDGVVDHVVVAGGGDYLRHGGGCLKGEMSTVGVMFYLVKVYLATSSSKPEWLTGYSDFWHTKSKPRHVMFGCLCG